MRRKHRTGAVVRLATISAAIALIALASLSGAWFGSGTAIAQQPPQHIPPPPYNIPPPPPPPDKPLPAPPGIHAQVASPNDNFGAAIVVGALPYNDTQVTTDNTMEPGEPTPCIVEGKTEWYNFTPSNTGTYQVSLTGSNFDTVVAVYTGVAVGALTNVGGCNDDFYFPGGFSLRQWEGIAGTTYRIQVGGFGGGFGTAVVSVTEAGGGSCSTNDGFEAGPVNTNNIPCWHTANVGPGSFCNQAGGGAPTGAPCPGPAFAVAPPPSGAQTAMSNEGAPSSSLLYRCGILRSGAISFLRYLNNSAAGWVTDPSLSSFVANEQFRADLVSATGMLANPFTTSPADVLLNLYQSNPGDPLVSPYLPVAGAAGAFVGTNVCLRFASVQTLNFLNVGIDKVTFDVCGQPWDFSSGAGNCFATTGLWHWESTAEDTAFGMSVPGNLAFNNGCNVINAVGGCTCDTGSAESGLATSPSFPAVTGAFLTFKTARQTEQAPAACTPFDTTTLLYSTNNGASFAPVDFFAGSGTITAGGQVLSGATGQICGTDLNAQTVTVVLPPGTTNIQFSFATGDAVLNGFAGQFIDDISILACGNADNDGVGGTFAGTVPPAFPWIRDGVAPEGLTSGGDACDTNDDNNGCSDAVELGPSHVTGGQRDPMNPWDFADMWVPALPAAGSRNGAVNIGDAVAVTSWIGAFTGGPPNANGNQYDTDLNGNFVKDGVEYDRSPSTTPGQPWRLNAPNGAVSIADALGVVNSIGDHC